MSSGRTLSLDGVCHFPEDAIAPLLLFCSWCSTENCPLLFEGAASWLREGLCGAQTQSEWAHVWTVLESAA